MADERKQRATQDQIYKGILTRARMMSEIEPKRVHYWEGYVRGLRRARYGLQAGTPADQHEKWLGLANDPEPGRRQSGQGYRDALREGPPLWALKT